MKVQQLTLLMVATVLTTILPTQTSQAYQSDRSEKMIAEAKVASLKRLEKDFAQTMQVSKLITKTGITGRNLITIETATTEGWNFNASMSDNGEWIKLIFPCTYSDNLTKRQLLNLLKENCELKNARFEEYFGMIHLVLPLENRAQSADELIDHLGLLYNEARRTRAKWDFVSDSDAKKSTVKEAQVPTKSPTDNRPTLSVTPTTPQLSGEDLQAKFAEVISLNKLVPGFLTYRDQRRSGDIEFFEGGETIWHAALKGEEPIRLSGSYKFENDKIKIQASEAQLISLDLITVTEDKLVFQNERLLLSVDISK